MNNLGHRISESGISTDEEKILKIKEWPIPRNKEELKTFVGLAGYYRKFVKNFADIVKPLEKLMNEH